MTGTNERSKDVAQLWTLQAVPDSQGHDRGGITRGMRAAWRPASDSAASAGCGGQEPAPVHVQGPWHAHHGLHQLQASDAELYKLG